MGVAACLSASPGSKTFKEGKALYETGKYEEAIALFKQCIIENPEEYGAKGNYMIALCYKRLDRCSKAASYFKLALSLDAEKGGASSMQKFEEQLNACKLTKEALASVPLPEEAIATASEATWLGWVLGMVVVGGIAISIVLIIRKKQHHRREIQQLDNQGTDDLYKIGQILFNEAIWLELTNRFGKDRTERLQIGLQEEYSHLVENKNPIGINDMLRKVKYLQTNPQKLFEEEEL